MKSNKLNYIIIGLFVALIIGGVLVSVTYLTGHRGATAEYKTVYGNVTGIKYGTQVLYEGYRIGQVETVNPVESHGQMRFEIVLSIEENWKIPNDSIALIEAPTLLSPIVINIHAGESTTPLEKGAVIPSEEASNIFAALTSVAGQVAELGKDIKPVLTTIDRATGKLADILEADGGALIHETRVAVEQVNKRLPAMMDDMSATIAEIKRLAASEDEDSVRGLMANANLMVKDLKGLAAGLQETLNKVDGVIANANGLIDGADTVVANVNGVVANANTVVDSAHGVVKNANGIVDSVQGVVKNADGVVDSVHGVVKNADGIVDSVQGVIKNADGVVANANSIVDSVRGAANSVDAAVAENRKLIRAIVADLRHTSNALARHIDAITANVEGASRNFNELGRRLRNDPSILIRGTEAADDSRRRRR